MKKRRIKMDKVHCLVCHRVFSGKISKYLLCSRCFQRIKSRKNELNMKQITISLQKAKTQTINEFKSKAQKVQKELKDNIPERIYPKNSNSYFEAHKEIDKIFAKNFGLNEGEENKDG